MMIIAIRDEAERGEKENERKMKDGERMDGIPAVFSS